MSGLPHHLDLEQALLGALMFHNKLLHRLPPLTSAHFYEPLHGRIFDAIASRVREERLADAVTLKREFAADGALSSIGGAPYLAGLMEAGIVGDEAAIAYADMIRDTARRRAVILAAHRAIAAAETGEGDALQGLEADLHEIAAVGDDSDEAQNLGDVMSAAIARAECGEAMGLSTGFEQLDAATGGLQPGTLWVVGGATSMGKSVFGAALSRNIARQGRGVVEFHLEMDETQIGLRSATALAFRMNSRGTGPDANPGYLKALRGKLSDEQWARVKYEASRAAKLPIRVDTRPGRTLSQIEANGRRALRRMEREGIAPGAIVIDHEGLIAPEPGQRFASLLERASARGEGLLAMGKRLGVPVIALAQITNEGSRADGADRLPVVTDIKYGGALTQAASAVLLIHRKAYHAERKPVDQRKDADWEAIRSTEATLVVDKARAGVRQHITICMDMPTAAVFEPGGAAHAN